MPATTAIAGMEEFQQTDSDNRREKILIAENNKGSRKLLRLILGELDYDIFEAVDGKEAFELYSKYEFDLVLVDYLMPVMDGIEFTQKVKTIGKQQFTPIIILTGIEDERRLEKCIECGIDDLLLKPYKHIVLKLKVQSWLRAKKMHDEIELQKQELLTRDMQHEDDLLAASEIVNSFINYDSQNMGNMKSIVCPVDILSGDIILVAMSPSGSQNILLGDFTGHGLPAAIGSMVMSELFYTMTSKGFSIEEIVLEINHKLRNLLPSNRFMSACLLELNFTENLLSVVNAGLPDVLVFDKENHVNNRIVSQNLPLGVLPENKLEIQVERVNINSTTRVLLYTDGLIESTNPNGEMFGYKNVKEAIEQSGHVFSPYYNLITNLCDFRQDGKSQDDTTIIQFICDVSLLKKKKKNQSQTLPRIAANWNMSVELDMNLMRDIDPIPPLVNYLIGLQGTELCREKIYTVLSELYSNSLEHGILGLDSDMKKDGEGFAEYYQLRDNRIQENSDGKIEIQLSHKPTDTGGQLNIRVIDNGSGFNYEAINQELGSNSDLKGRGVSLIKKLSDSCYYDNNGNLVNLNYSWRKTID